MDAWLKKKFGKYRVKKFIGKGTIGSVYQAEHVDTKKIFAIKIFDLRLSHALKQKLDLLDEVKTLQHENIVDIYERGEEHSTYYLIMEYIEGQDLLQIIKEKKRLDYTFVLDIAKGVVKALIYAHKRGIIHRDIKPGNIIITKNFKVKITDFGMAKIVSSVSDLSQLDKIISTVFYISPEQAMGVKKIDHRTDFYSLGITLYQALTGQIPYPGRTPLQVLQQHISTPLPRITKIHSDIPNEIEKIVAKLTAKKRNERYQSAEKVLDKIAECRSKLKKKKEIFSVLPTWLISGMVFLVLFFVSFTLANKILKISENKKLEKKGALFSINKISITNSLGQKDNIFAKNSIICIEIDWYIKQLPKKNTHKTFTIIFRGRNLNPITQNLGIAKLGKQYHKYCVSLHNFNYGKHVVDIAFIIGDVKNKKEIFFEIPQPVQTIASISIYPKNVTLRPNSNQKFEYKLIDTSGNTIKNQKHISWKASGGQIDDGIYTAGKKEGAFSVSIQSINGKIKAHTTITIKKNTDKKTRGWFGESMPLGLAKSRTKGEYLWEKDRSMMVFVPSGKFWFGSKNKKLKYVNSFYIDKYELSKKQYQEFCKKTNRKFMQQPKWSAAEYPIVNVSWNEAKDYAIWVGKVIPREIEWEKAAKGGLRIPDWRTDKKTVPLMLNPRPQRAYPWGDQFPNENGIYRCNYVSNDKWDERHLDGYKRGAPIFAFSRWKSPYGCVNLAGNVWEWCFDSYSEKISQKKDLSKRILRGGSWYNHAKGCRTTRNQHGLVNEKSEFIGIRLGIRNKGSRSK